MAKWVEYTIAHKDKTWIEVKGLPVESALPGTFVHKTPPYLTGEEADPYEKWTVSETTTGFGLVSGETKQEAISKLHDLIERKGLASFVEAIEAYKQTDEYKKAKAYKDSKSLESWLSE